MPKFSDFPITKSGGNCGYEKSNCGQEKKNKN